MALFGQRMLASQRMPAQQTCCVQRASTCLRGLVCCAGKAMRTSTPFRRALCVVWRASCSLTSLLPFARGSKQRSNSGWSTLASCLKTRTAVSACITAFGARALSGCRKKAPHTSLNMLRTTYPSWPGGCRKTPRNRSSLLHRTSSKLQSMHYHR